MSRWADAAVVPVIAGITLALGACAEFHGAGKEAAATSKDFGHEVKDAAIEVGHGARKVARKVGKATEGAVHEVHEDIRK